MQPSLKTEGKLQVQELSEQNFHWKDDPNTDGACYQRSYY